jgi:hypothetical protein
MKLRVRKLDKEDVYRGLIRVPQQHRKDPSGREIPEGSVIEVKTGSKSLLGVVRGDPGATDPSIRMDELFRNRLEVEPDGEYDFELKRKGVFAEFRFHWSSPEPANRFAMRMAILSVAAGILGLILGLCSLALRH